MLKYYCEEGLNVTEGDMQKKCQFYYRFILYVLCSNTAFD